MRRTLLLPLLLAACGEPADKGTTITIDGDNGTASASADGSTGAVRLDLPGFKADLKLPRIKLDAADFDLNGVHLYPGSTIENVDVKGTDNDGRIRVAFSSPAAPAAVRDWFDARLRKAGFTLRTDGNALVGTDDENKPFRMELQGAGADRARGTIVMGD